MQQVGDRDHHHTQVCSGRELLAGVVQHVPQDVVRHRGPHRRQETGCQISIPRQLETDQRD